MWSSKDAMSNSNRAHSGSRTPAFSGAAHLTAREIAAALRRGHRSGANYVACCPSHEDRTPSLSLTDASDGTVLVHCHTGCSQQDVIVALQDLGLWPRLEREWL